MTNKKTRTGFRAIGCGYLLSTFAAVFINISLSSKTRPVLYMQFKFNFIRYNLQKKKESLEVFWFQGKGFSFSFPIEVKNVRLGIHSSDSGVYDKDGRYILYGSLFFVS